jgi:tetratricopeptide (TPR) repeat protein
LLRGEALARQQFADDSALRARLLLALSNLTSELDEQDRTMALLHEAQSAAAGTGDVVLQAAIDCAIAADLAGEPDAAKAEAMFAAALKRVADGPDADRSTHAVCLYLRAVRALEASTAQAAVGDSRAALDILGTPRPGQRTMALSMRMNLAGALAKSGDLPGAIANLKQGIDDLTAMGRGQTVGAVTFQNNLGVLRVRAGDPLGALEAFEKAVKIQGDTEVGASLSMNVAQQLVAVGRQQEAVALHERTRILAVQRGDFRIQAYGTVDFNYCPPQQASRCDQRLTEARRVLAGFLPSQHPVFGALETTVAQRALARGDVQPRTRRYCVPWPSSTARPLCNPCARVPPPCWLAPSSCWAIPTQPLLARRKRWPRPAR